MEHFPYLNRLWFGEYFDYEKNKPDFFFLTEVSGIPFGLMGEMLQNDGKPMERNDLQDDKQVGLVG